MFSSMLDRFRPYGSGSAASGAAASQEAAQAGGPVAWRRRRNHRAEHGCSNGCSCAAAEGYDTCCLPCAKSGGVRHSPVCPVTLRGTAPPCVTCLAGKAAGGDRRYTSCCQPCAESGGRNHSVRCPYRHVGDNPRVATGRNRVEPGYPASGRFEPYVAPAAGHEAIPLPAAAAAAHEAMLPLAPVPKCWAITAVLGQQAAGHEASPLPLPPSPFPTFPAPPVPEAEREPMEEPAMDVAKDPDNFEDF